MSVRNKQNIPSKAEKRAWMIPAYAAIAIILFCIIIFWAAVTSVGDDCRLPFLTANGTFRYRGVKFLFITPYLTLMVLGAGIALLSAQRRRGHLGLSRMQALVLSVLFCVQLLIGGKVCSAIGSIITKGSTAEINFSGQNLFGGLYSTLIVVPILARVFHVRAADLFDFFTPCCLIPVAFTKLGCFTAGCCAAKLTFINDAAVQLPIQLIESAFVFLLLSLCLWLAFRNRARKESSCRIFPVMLICYSVLRMALEPLRKKGFLVLGIHATYLHCLIILLIGVILHLVFRKADRFAIADAEVSVRN